MLSPSLLITLAPLAPTPPPTDPAPAPPLVAPSIPTRAAALEAALAPSTGFAGPTAAALQDAEAEDTEAPPEPPSWVGALGLGSSIATGNTNTRAVNFTFDAVLDRSQVAASNRWTLKGWYNYSDEKTDGVPGSKAIANNLYGMVKYDQFLTPKNYLFGNASGEEDELQDLDLRAIVGAGYGRQFRDDEVLILAGELGLAYRKETYEDAPNSSGPNGQLSANIDWKFRKGWALMNASQIYPSLEDKNDVYAKVDTRLRTELNEDLFLQLQWVFDWNNAPATGKDTVDNRVILTIGWSF